MATASNRLEQVKVASGLNVLAGLWLVIAPWIYSRGAAEGPGLYTGSILNNVIVGLIVALFAAFRFFNPARNVMLSWLNCLLGLWMFVSPWVYGYTDNRARFYNSLIFGVIIAILGAWSALESRGMHAAAPHPARA